MWILYSFDICLGEGYGFFDPLHFIWVRYVHQPAGNGIDVSCGWMITWRFDP